MYKVNTLIIMILSVALIFIEYAVILYENRPPEWYFYPIFEDQFLPQDMIVPIPNDFVLEETPRQIGFKEMHPEIFEDMEITYIKIHLRSKGWYFITAYCNCSKCCTYANQATASGIYPHYSDYERRLDEPTTCAIDRSVHRFGDTFYLKSMDRVYVAEDTGSGVKGRHIDLYFHDHSYVQSYGSHWEEVFDIEIEEITFRVGDFRSSGMECPHYPYWQRMLHYEMFGYDIEEKGIDGKGREKWKKMQS